MKVEYLRIHVKDPRDRNRLLPLSIDYRLAESKEAFQQLICFLLKIDSSKWEIYSDRQPISSSKVSHINHGSILEVWPKLVGGIRAKDKTTGRGEEPTSSSDSDDDAQSITSIGELCEIEESLRSDQAGAAPNKKKRQCSKRISVRKEKALCPKEIEKASKMRCCGKMCTRTLINKEDILKCRKT
ncbi:uncharacterized protein LOC114973044 isoform X2 [Acropora millepora]|uniref:uncharacterized protein LOC114973044 isoform X2 n=1 Tax=Acropora millepora TaxID=45264 RepID=UPI001CF34D1C|nr:uncharacterized protein LOC114973044 isoform X2 [Acropora millepora]